MAIDTEYDSLRYFRDKLCLIQVGTEERTYLFDPLDRKLEFSFLGKICRSPAQVKILHAGDNDIRILKRDYGFEFRNVFDTQRGGLAAGLRTPWRSPRSSKPISAFRSQDGNGCSVLGGEPSLDGRADRVRRAGHILPDRPLPEDETGNRGPGLGGPGAESLAAVSQARWSEKAFDERSLGDQGGIRIWKIYRKGASGRSTAGALNGRGDEYASGS
ncbi:MAG: hypothetical protein IPI61_14895 [Syntrophaceae bacterium]|nr:hypothetical protein [Syntrophaceae bacterium]